MKVSKKEMVEVYMQVRIFSALVRNGSINDDNIII